MNRLQIKKGKLILVLLQFCDIIKLWTIGKTQRKNY